MVAIPPILSLSFIALVAVLYSLLILGATWSNGRSHTDVRWRIIGLRVFGGGFLLITGLLALQGTFLNFGGKPPAIAFPIAIAFLAVIALGISPLVGRWIEEIPQTWLIGLQSFRVLVEIQLYFLAQLQLVPKLMTFEGSNFDILTGLSAPFVAYFLARRYKSKVLDSSSEKIILAWNVMGLALLFNVASRGLLSTPTAMRLIFDEPANTAIGYFPFVWLPCFIVPFALLLHILSLRKVMRSKSSRLVA